MESKPARRATRFMVKYRCTECLNCGHPLDLSDRYCPNCSQLNSSKKLTMKDFAEEFFGSIIDYDSRLLRTISALLLRPGRISLDYVAGKRVTYTNPFRFLLSLAIIYFLLMQMSGDFRSLDRLNLDQQAQKVDPGAFNLDLEVDGIPKEEVQAALDSIKGKDSLGLVDRLLEEERKKDSALRSNPKVFFEQVEGGFVSRLFKKSESFYRLMAKDTLFAFSEAEQKYGIANTRENRMSFNGARSVKRALSRPGSFVKDLVSRLPLVTFFFLPVFTVFVWLVYIRKKYTYTDNLVFSFHNQSLFFILLIIGYLFENLVGWDINGLCVLAFCIYLYAAMRKFYQQGHFKTILKFVFLNMVFFLLALFAGLVVLFSSAITY